LSGSFCQIEFAPASKRAEKINQLAGLEPMAYSLLSPVLPRGSPRKGNNMKNLKLTIVGGLLSGALMIPGLPVTAHAKNDKGDKKHHGGLHIPPGHLPPPGKCRIWYPGTPPGHQPAPGDCQMLSRQLPQGAVLVSRDRVWRDDERPHYHYHPRHVYDSRPVWWDDHRHGVYDRRNYANRREIRKDIRDVREARKDVRQDRQELQKNVEELKKDRAELRKDIREGASRKEIRQDRREIRQSRQEVAESKKELGQSRDKLGAARQELREDLRRR
jgi:hypothetical protein